MKPNFTPETAANFLSDLAAYRSARDVRQTALDAFFYARRDMKEATLAAYPDAFDDIEGVTSEIHLADVCQLIGAPEAYKHYCDTWKAYESACASVPADPNRGGLFEASWERAARAALQQVAA